MKLAPSLKIKIIIFVIIGTFRLQRPDLSHRAFSLLYLWAGYRIQSCTGDNNFIKWKGPFWYTRPKRANPSKWTTLIFRSNQTKKFRSVGFRIEIFWNFGLNRKHPVSPYKNHYHVLHFGNLPRRRNIPKFKDRADWSCDTFQPMRRRACVYQQTNQNIAPVIKTADGVGQNHSSFRGSQA